MVTTNHKALAEALTKYIEINRCWNPIKIPLPNPQGYASNVECHPCGKCNYCLAMKALKEYKELCNE